MFSRVCFPLLKFILLYVLGNNMIILDLHYCYHYYRYYYYYHYPYYLYMLSLPLLTSLVLSSHFFQDCSKFSGKGRQISH